MHREGERPLRIGQKDLVSKKISWEKACAAGQTEPLQMNAKRSEVLEHMD